MVKDLSWEIKSLSSTKEITEIGIFRFFTLFSKIWKIGERYKANKMEGKVESCLTPILTLKDREEKLFQKYLVFLFTR